ncbi:MAG TPA: DNA polymerase III subunit delta' [Usitatibacteraceae bacterium]|nr:DNA polymerase III subunit delta' [Usitatibacteraceae bacterium]
MSAAPWLREPLERLMARRDRLPHALLVSGRPGIGKREFAREFARSLLCESPVDRLACGQCPSCHWFGQANHPDYREIVPESAEDDESDGAEAAAGKDAGKKSLVIKIAQVRAIREFVALSTHRAGFRAIVLHPAESMQPAAANALLKTLEEPPPATAIVLVSDRPARLPATIRSRCESIVLRVPSREIARAWLDAAGAGEPDIALALAGGAPMLAATLARTEEREWRRRVVAELSRPEGARTLAFATGFDRAFLERTIFVMQTWVHDLVRVKSDGEPRHHVDSVPAIRAKARRAHLERLLALDRELLEARRLVAHPLNARLVAEHLMMAYNRATLA